MATFELKLDGTLQVKKKKKDKITSVITLTYGNFKVTTKGNKMAYTLPADMQVHVQVSYVDAHNNPATVDGPIEWESSDDTIATVTVDNVDTSKATVKAVGKVGQVQVTAMADADLGTGIRELTTLMDVTVVAGEAVAGTITPVGEAEPIS
jgi:hypothetical protein